MSPLRPLLLLLAALPAATSAHAQERALRYAG